MIDGGDEGRFVGGGDDNMRLRDIVVMVLVRHHLLLAKSLSERTHSNLLSVEQQTAEKLACQRNASPGCDAIR